MDSARRRFNLRGGISTQGPKIVILSGSCSNFLFDSKYVRPSLDALRAAQKAREATGYESVLAPRVFLRVLRFSSLHKLLNSNSIRNNGPRATLWKCHFKLPFIYFILFIVTRFPSSNNF